MYGKAVYIEIIFPNGSKITLIRVYMREKYDYFTKV